MTYTYKYTALKKDGTKLQGSLEAVSPQDAKSKLHGMGLIVLTIVDIAQKGGKTLSMSIPQLTLFTTQLAQLLESNIPLFDCLEVLEDQAEGDKSQPLIRAVKEKIKSGISFSKAIGSYPDTFSTTYVAIITSGEAVGGLTHATKRLSTLLVKEQGMKNRLISALLYPLLLTALLFVALGIMLFYVIPSIQGLFEGKELPLFSQIIFSISSYVNNHFFLVMTLFIGSLSWIILEVRHPIILKGLSKKAIFWPIIGPYLIKSSLQRFSRTVATLLEGGSPLNIALEKATAVVSNPLIIQSLKKAQDRVLQGEMLSQAFNQPLFPKLFRRMVALGEETGRLEFLIGQVGDLYEEETSRLLERATSLIQPILLICFGVLIGSSLLAILLPLSNFGSLMSM